MNTIRISALTAALVVSLSANTLAQDSISAELEDEVKCTPLTEAIMDECCGRETLEEFLNGEDLLGCREYLDSSTTASTKTTDETALSASADEELGNPGNTKETGQAGEQPSDGEWGGGAEGRGDTGESGSGDSSGGQGQEGQGKGNS